MVEKPKPSFAPDEQFSNTAVAARRGWAEDRSGADLKALQHDDAGDTYRGNIEELIGFVRLPVGLAGPLRLDGQHAKGDFLVPMATTEGTLVDATLAGSGEGHAVRLELTHSDGSLTGHVLDGVLVTEPVGALDGIVEVVPPVILVHVAESSIDTSLYVRNGTVSTVFNQIKDLSDLPGQRRCAIWSGKAWKCKQS